jgi:amidase
VVLGAVGAVLLPPAAAPAAHRPRWLRSAGPPGDDIGQLAEALDAELVVGPVPGTGDITGLLAAFRTIQAAEAWQLHGGWITAHPGALASDVEARFRAGADVSPDTRRHAADVLARGRDEALGALSEHTWLVLPAAGGPGHARDASGPVKDAWRLATLRHTVIASAFGLPSCVLPGRVRPSSGRPPAGTALVGPPGADHALLEAAQRAVRPATSS